VTHGGNLFAVAAERGWDWRDVADFSASINPLGPSPRVAPAICAALDQIRHYPDREPRALCAALATHWGVDENQILAGNGATELLHFFARVWRNRKVTLAVPVFSEFHRAYPHAAQVAATNLDAWPDDGLLVVTQPLNPTGEVLRPPRLRTWLLDTSCPVLVDESFLDFTGLESVASLLERRPGLFVLRSLTKFHALPGLRVGALLGAAEAIARLRAQREPWQVNILAEAAAVAALEDAEHHARTLAYVAAERTWLEARLRRLPGVEVTPSAANYLFVRLAYSSAALAAFLLERKILVRDCQGWPGISGCAIRVAVRTRPEHERLLAAWEEFPCAA
jgi:threonine-phosphate decarboxylase